MSGLVSDSVEDILVRLDGEDLIRCKSVCKSWLSLISSSCFVKTQLDYNKNKDHNNHELGHRRIIMPSRYGTPNDNWYINGPWHIIGSSNGLVCVSPEDAQVLVTNPLTREVKKLQPDPQFSDDVVINRDLLCWGFGHDSSTDDYKVVAGIKVHKVGTLFHVLSLKSNIWEPISLVKYKFIAGDSRFGILWNGALHWFMKDYNTKKMVILSFDLSREEFNECPQPDDSRYVFDDSTRLGIFNKCLCIFGDDDDDPPYQRWVMKNYNDKDSWEPLPYECEMNKNDVTHTLECCTPHGVWCFCDDKRICLPKTRDYTGAPIFVKSIVSPHVDQKPKKKRKPNIDIKSLEALFDYDDNSRLFCWQRRTKIFMVR
ncbi:F-box/kelch-repeat protein-like protein isoform X1 [Tanacetum coccineum]|uniref:F-box/kelch-repeat protein-like protein isoform X1 n=1 Tax=Tanacetum coccineum TaxID=301880 RepID=A0ABQ5ACW1_9ASTR